jgi:hypothetical protein
VEIERRFSRDQAGPDWEGRTTRLGCTDLKDKLRILQAEPDIGTALTTDSNDLNRLRNKLAHSDNYVWGNEPVENFCKGYELATKWVLHFHKLLANKDTVSESAVPTAG